jgi:hypothetical protein
MRLTIRFILATNIHAYKFDIELMISCIQHCNNVSICISIILLKKYLNNVNPMFCPFAVESKVCHKPR